MAVHVKKYQKSAYFLLFFGTKFYLYISGRESSDKRPPIINHKKNKK